ncbi:hypothetical protein N7528_008586 [Penicillium herquei]|nr:hypothetical protein N7528_008586 [Penicillium herquei]
MFFPETSCTASRLTIEEVSVLFDTGRLGSSTAATAELRRHEKEELPECENAKPAIDVCHVEHVEHK